MHALAVLRRALHPLGMRHAINVDEPTRIHLAALAARLGKSEGRVMAEALAVLEEALSPEESAAAWDAEIARRVAALDAGETRGESWESVLARARTKLAT